MTFSKVARNGERPDADAVGGALSTSDGKSLVDALACSKAHRWVSEAPTTLMGRMRERSKRGEFATSRFIAAARFLAATRGLMAVSYGTVGTLCRAPRSSV